MNKPLIQATIRWNDTGEILEDVLIKQTHDIEDDDEEIFFYGITWENIDDYRTEGIEDFTIIDAELLP